jgi:lipopolysaccharide transport system permease protein
MSISRPPPPRALQPFAFATELWQRRELLWQFTIRNLEIRHKGSYLGFVWSLLNPLLMLALYVFVFGYIFGGSFNGLRGETKVDYALALFLGLALFQFLGEILAVAPALVVANPNFVKKVVFPLEILPAAAVGSSLFHMLISLGLVLLGVATVGPGLSGKLLWLPLVVLPMIPFGLGLAWGLSAIGVFFRDVNQLIGFLSMAWMYASAIFFPLRLIPPVVWAILRFNPLLLAVDLARDAVMWEHAINLRHLAFLWAISLVVCAAGYALFRRTSPAFADVL